jgi:radical SAM superfamily enzyme YgiQ (UPF0313 family)
VAGVRTPAVSSPALPRLLPRHHLELAMTRSRSVLLSSVCKPFGAKWGDGFSTRPSALWQNTWVQGVFIPETVDFHWGLDIIAQNLQTPTTVLHYPTMRRFIADLRAHHYDYVGISFNSCTFHKLVPMVEAVRRYSPWSKIVLGGYGTTMPDEELAPYADHICREEAVGFMRRLLGEPARPFEHPLVTVRNDLFSLPILGRTGLIAVGLGCPNGCDFCLTSHYFKRKHICYLDSGEAIVDVMRRYRERWPDLSTFCIYDEDLLLDEKRGRQLLAAMRKADFVPNITIFTSMKALSHYQPSELAEMGIASVWVGFEGMRAGYKKMQSDQGFRETLAALRKVGIGVVLCMIIGFDYQTRETVLEELDEFIACKPAFAQFMIYGPAGGTPLLARMRAEGRLNDRYDNRRLHEGYSLLFKHPHIGTEEMEALLREIYQREYEANGPSIYRVMEMNIEAYWNLKESENPRLRERARQLREFLKFCWGARDAGLRYAPNDEVRGRIRKLYEDMEQVTGQPSLANRALSALGPLAAAWTNVRYEHEVFMQPPTIERRYPLEAAAG